MGSGLGKTLALVDRLQKRGIERNGRIVLKPVIISLGSRAGAEEPGKDDGL